MDHGKESKLGADAGAEVQCGLFLTTKTISKRVEAGVLVFYHNHGEPGPGVYPVTSWQNNKAVFSNRGTLLPYPGYERTLKPLKPEGFYVVREEFTCCERRCQVFPVDTLVQLGYRRDGTPLLFNAVWTYKGIVVPVVGTKVREEKLGLLRPVKVLEDFKEADLEPDEPVVISPLPTDGWVH